MPLAKTRRLAALFPDAYAVDDTASLLYRMLDVIGAELSNADDGIKRLLTSHWVDYATGPALDGLAGIFDLTRRRLGDGSPEPDGAFRQRLRAVVPLFTGGGTVAAVRGAVRSALGLPFDLAAAGLPDALRADLERLVTIEEYTAGSELVVGEAAASGDGTSVELAVDSRSVMATHPQLTITGTRGTGWSPRVERLGEPALRGVDGFFLPPGVPLVLTAGRATLGTADVSASFLGSLPTVPVGGSEWRIAVRGVPFDLAAFDDHSFGPPDLRVELAWPLAQPLTFNVHIPNDVRAAVDTLRARHGYPGPILLFEGLPPDAIQAVVDDTRAAGVRATVLRDVEIPS
jgi:hypothetical protein